VSQWLGFETITNGKKCKYDWEDEWSSMCENDCPTRGERHTTAYDSDDLTEIIEERDGTFIVYRSAPNAEYYPGYERIASFPTSQDRAISAMAAIADQ
jgi:hypothetical protein